MLFYRGNWRNKAFIWNILTVFGRTSSQCAMHLLSHIRSSPTFSLSPREGFLELIKQNLSISPPRAPEKLVRRQLIAQFRSCLLISLFCRIPAMTSNVHFVPRPFSSGHDFQNAVIKARYIGKYLISVKAQLYLVQILSVWRIY